MEISASPRGNHYYLANKHLFAMRNDNGASINKWMGLWEGENKLIDGINYKVRVNDDEYELFNHCTKTVYKGINCEHHFKLPGVKVRENSFLAVDKKVLTSTLEFKNDSPSKKVITINFTVNVNTRNYSENWHQTEYVTKYEAYGKHVHVHSDKGDVLYGAGRVGRVLTNFYPSSVYNEYDSGSDRQRNYTPGAYTVQFELDSQESREIPFIIACSTTGLNKVLIHFVDMQKGWESELKELEKLEKERAKKYAINAGGELERLAYWNHNALRMLEHETGLFAGYPWFTQHWARDTFWSFKSLLCTGDSSVARQAINDFEKHLTDKGIPNQLRNGGEKNYDSLDATPLFVIALNDYINYTGDFQYLNSKKALINSLDQYFSKGIEWDASKSQTWMDTLKREGAVDVQALHAHALKCMSELVKPFNQERSRQYYQMHEKEKDKLNDYWLDSKGYYKDSFESESLTPNQLVPLLFDLAPKEKVRAVLERMLSKEMLSSRGLRTLSSSDPQYSPEAYHKGKAWGLTTNWLVTALLKENNALKSSELLKTVYKNLDEHALGCLSETFNPETGEPRDASCQLWSSSIIISALDEELFGIKPELLNHQITLSPCILKGKVERYDKIIGDNLVDLELESTDKETIINLYFAKKTTLKVLLKFKDKQPKSVFVNGKPCESHEFQASSENNIIIVF